MKRLKCCVIDDEPLAQELIKSYIEQTNFLEFVASFSSCSMAIKTIIETDIDLVFLDIQMSELNGIEFARVIPKHCKIVFITAYAQYAVDAFRANAVDYLLKPINYIDFLASANKVLQIKQLEHRAVNTVPHEEECVIVKSEYKLIQIPLNKILYIESIKDYVKIYLDDDTTVMSLMSIKNIEEKLSKAQFMRVHRSFIVHTNKIRLIERNRIVFGKQYIPVSDTYKPMFIDYINKHTFIPVKDA
ncbi:MAG: LytR/AlgR family response regulator transcription factor [Muribaculaceae bacterium]